MGIDLILSTDAHATEQLDYMKYGLDVARRGWCTVENIVNTRNLEGFQKALAKSSAR